MNIGYGVSTHIYMLHLGITLTAPLYSKPHVFKTHVKCCTLLSFHARSLTIGTSRSMVLLVLDFSSHPPVSSRLSGRENANMCVLCDMRTQPTAELSNTLRVNCYLPSYAYVSSKTPTNGLASVSVIDRGERLCPAHPESYNKDIVNNNVLRDTECLLQLLQQSG